MRRFQGRVHGRCGVDGVIDYGEGISAVDSLLVRPMQTAVHLIVEGGRAAIVDTASGNCVPRVLAALAERGVAPEQVDYVVLTHVHLDHAAGAGEFVRCCPNARLVVHPRGARHMIDPSRLWAATVSIYGAAQAQRMYGELVPVPAGRVVEVSEGARLHLGGRELFFHDMAGHARHHVVIRDGRSGHLFAGDTFGFSYRELDSAGRQYIFPTTSPSQFDPEALCGSIERISALGPEAVYVTHFGQLRDIPRLAADLQRLINAHVTMARRVPVNSSSRVAELQRGVREIVLAEGKSQGWNLSGEALLGLFALDIELNAQGLAVWIESPDSKPPSGK